MGYIRCGGGKKVKIICLGAGTSFDVKTRCTDVDYTKLTVDNFLVVFGGGSASYTWKPLDMGDWVNNNWNANASAWQSVSYNASTGVLTASGAVKAETQYSVNDWKRSNTSTAAVTVYLVVGEIETA